MYPLIGEFSLIYNAIPLSLIIVLVILLLTKNWISFIAFLGFTIFYYVFILWLNNYFVDQEARRPVSENAFSNILKSHIVKIQESDKKEVNNSATIAILNIIAEQTDPDKNNFDNTNSKDFVSEVVFKTYKLISTLDSLENYSSNLIKNLSKEEARTIGIGQPYKLEGNESFLNYQNKKSFFLDINFNRMLKVIHKSWNRACKTDKPI